jgi:hypothetical protein
METVFRQEIQYLRHSGVDLTNPENETETLGTIVDAQRKIGAAGLAHAPRWVCIIARRQ